MGNEKPTSLTEVIARALAQMDGAQVAKSEPEPPSQERLADAGQLMVDRGYLPHDVEAFAKLSEWIAGDRKRGLCLSGPVGTGKTHFIVSVLRSFRSATAAQIVSIHREWQEYNDSFWHAAFGFWDSEQGQRVAIDDLGQEPQSVVYGQRDEVMSRVLDDRYLAWQKDHDTLTVITTNLAPNEIVQRYGARIGDRLAEMCVFVQFTGESQR